MRPFQIGAFPDGNFLIAGLADDNSAKVALVRSTGQLDRFLEIKKDVRSDSHELEEYKKNGNSISPAETKSFAQAVRLSMIIPDGPNLLLARRGLSLPIFSITPGTAVEEIELHVPARYSLFSLQPSGSRLLAQFIYREEGIQGVKFVTYSIDRESGKPIESFAYPTPLGFGMGCVDGTEFHFLKSEPDTSLTMLTLMPAGRSSRKSDAAKQ